MSDRNPSSNDDSSLRVPRTRPNPTEGSLQLDLFGNPPTPTRRFRESARPDNLGSAPKKPAGAAPRPADAIHPDFAHRPHRLVTPAVPAEELPPPPKPELRPPAPFREPVLEPPPPAPLPPPEPDPVPEDAEPEGPFFPRLTRPWLIGFAVATVLVVLWAVLSARSAARKTAPPEPQAEEPVPAEVAPAALPPAAAEVPAEPQDVPAEVPAGDVAAPEEAPPAEEAAPAAPERAPLPNWSRPGVWQAEQVGENMVFTFEKPVFVSADFLSKEGLAAVRDLARRLKSLDGAAAIEIVGHTDDERITNPNAKFASNEALARARAQRVEEHFASLLAGKRALRLSSRAGKEEEAPYPNDSDANRKRNRTASVIVSPAAP
jgi:flagellar motor protein MotB